MYMLQKQTNKQTNQKREKKNKRKMNYHYTPTQIEHNMFHSNYT